MGCRYDVLVCIPSLPAQPIVSASVTQLRSNASLAVKIQLMDVASFSGAHDRDRDRDRDHDHDLGSATHREHCHHHHETVCHY